MRREKDIPQWTKEWAESRAIPLAFFPQTDSSHQEARRLIPQALSSSLVALAARQTQGQGRKGRLWQESDLMASWLYKEAPPDTEAPPDAEAPPDTEARKARQRPAAPLAPLAPLSGAFASPGLENLALDFAKDLKIALESAFPALSLRLKAPNDILCGGKKTAGLLVDVVSSAPAVIVSLGLNVFTSPSKLPCAGSLKEGLQGGLQGERQLSFSQWLAFLDRLHARFSCRAQKSLRMACKSL